MSNDLQIAAAARIRRHYELTARRPPSWEVCMNRAKEQIAEHDRAVAEKAFADGWVARAEHTRPAWVEREPQKAPPPPSLNPHSRKEKP